MKSQIDANAIGTKDVNIPRKLLHLMKSATFLAAQSSLEFLGSEITIQMRNNYYLQETAQRDFAERLHEQHCLVSF